MGETVQHRACLLPVMVLGIPSRASCLQDKCFDRAPVCLYNILHIHSCCEWQDFFGFKVDRNHALLILYLSLTLAGCFRAVVIVTNAAMGINVSLIPCSELFWLCTLKSCGLLLITLFLALEVPALFFYSHYSISAILPGT